MAYTLSMDASLKAKKENLKGIINHHFRSVLEKNGIHLEHKNTNIDPTRTSQNMSMYYDQPRQAFLPCTDTRQILESLNTRLATVKKPLRADAVLCRNLVLQLDPEFYKTATEKEKEDSYFAMLGWATKVFNKQNMVGTSIHRDETNPHVHVVFTPVTPDGRLSQKDWFPNPASLREMHTDFRTHMSNKGYNISFNKQPPRKHLADEDFKTLKQSEENIADINNKEQALLQRANAITQLESNLLEDKTTLEAEKANIEAYNGKLKDMLTQSLTQSAQLLTDSRRIHTTLENQYAEYSANKPISNASLNEKALKQRESLASAITVDNSLLPSQHNKQKEMSL